MVFIVFSGKQSEVRKQIKWWKYFIFRCFTRQKINVARDVTGVRCIITESNITEVHQKSEKRHIYNINTKRNFCTLLNTLYFGNNAFAEICLFEFFHKISFWTCLYIFSPQIGRSLHNQIPFSVFILLISHLVVLVNFWYFGKSGSFTTVSTVILLTQACQRW